MFNNTSAYRMKNITRLNGTDPSADPKLQLVERLLKNCYNDNITHSRVLPDQHDPGGPMCPRTFDGFACWDKTPATMIAYQACPEFVVGFDPRRSAFKRCTANGTWTLHPDGRKPWTNYTTCVDVEDLDFRSVVNEIYVYGYSVSVAALVLSIAIFLLFRFPFLGVKRNTRGKTLYCTRIRIHLNLFTAFALNNILWIIWYKTVVNDAEVLQNNKEWCQLLHVATYYFMVASYLWMFCEGLHLHIALVVVFVKDVVPMKFFIFFGWGVSMIVIAGYASSRYSRGEIERCWMEPSDSFWIIIAPVALSMFLSLLFLINVLWVLVMKLYPAPNYRASIAIKKATRAALILIPLFGLHFILIPFRPPVDSPAEKVYQVASALLISLQGLCVAILFCFTNQEVHIAIRSFFPGFLRINEGMPMTGVTGGESVIHTRDNVV